MKETSSLIGKFLAIMLSLLFSVFIVGFVYILNIRNFTSEKNINKMINSVDVSKFLMEVEDGKIWNGLVSLGSTKNLTEEDVSVLLNSEEIKSAASKYFSSVFKHATKKESVYALSKDELSNVFSKSIDSFNSRGEKKIDNQTKADILDFVETNHSLFIKFLPMEDSVDKFIKEKGYDKVIDVYNKLISEKSLTIFVVACIVYIFIVCVLTWSYYKWIFYTALSSLIASLLAFSSSCSVQFSKLEIENDTGTYFLEIYYILKNNVASNLFISSFILLIFSIFVFVIYGHFKGGIIKEEQAKILEEPKESDNKKSNTKKETELATDKSTNKRTTKK